jgi:hypothetical protein
VCPVSCGKPASLAQSRACLVLRGRSCSRWKGRASELSSRRPSSLLSSPRRATGPSGDGPGSRTFVAFLPGAAGYARRQCHSCGAPAGSRVGGVFDNLTPLRCEGVAGRVWYPLSITRVSIHGSSPSLQAPAPTLTNRKWGTRGPGAHAHGGGGGERGRGGQGAPARPSHLHQQRTQTNAPGRSGGGGRRRRRRAAAGRADAVELRAELRRAW